jgi:hypothetical protein
MEDDLSVLPNGRQPFFFEKRKTTSNIWKREDNLKEVENRRQLKSLVREDDKHILKMENNFNILSVENNINFFFNWNLTCNK